MGILIESLNCHIVVAMQRTVILCSSNGIIKKREKEIATWILKIHRAFNNVLCHSNLSKQRKVRRGCHGKIYI